MIKRLLAVAALLLFTVPAMAAMNIQQRGDGTAEWNGATDTKRFGNCAGGVNLQMPVQLNILSTGYAVSPVTNGVIRGAYAVSPVATTGTATLKLWVNQTTTPVRFYNTANTVTSDAVLTFSTASAGTVARISQASETLGGAGLIHQTIKEGDFIAVGSNGSATGLSTAQVVVQVCPR